MQNFKKNHLINLMNNFFINVYKSVDKLYLIIDFPKFFKIQYGLDKHIC